MELAEELYRDQVVYTASIKADRDLNALASSQFYVVRERFVTKGRDIKVLLIGVYDDFLLGLGKVEGHQGSRVCNGQSLNCVVNLVDL